MSLDPLPALNDVLESLAQDAELRSRLYLQAAGSVVPTTKDQFLARGDFMGRAFEAAEMAKLIRRAKR